MTTAKYLQRHYGGTWRYDKRSTWWCDDGRRHVARVSAGVDEFDEPVGPPQYWLYGDGTPVRVFYDVL